MGNTSKNYLKDGGDTTVIGGKLEVLEGATVTGLTETAAAASEAALGGVKAATADETYTVEVKIGATSKKLFVPTYPVIPVIANVPEVTGELTKDDFNLLLEKLMEAGLMAQPDNG